MRQEGGSRQAVGRGAKKLFQDDNINTKGARYVLTGRERCVKRVRGRNRKGHREQDL